MLLKFIRRTLFFIALIPVMIIAFFLYSAATDQSTIALAVAMSIVFAIPVAVIVWVWVRFLPSSGTLLKRATRQHDAGKINNAIRTLRHAYRVTRWEELWSHPIETYLRLPLYLQEAGKPKEAWKEFKRLLQGKYYRVPQRPDVISHHKKDADGFLPGERESDMATIYDKMRLFLQRENEPSAAVAYGLASHYLNCYLIKMNYAIEAFKKEMDADQNVLDRMLKQAKVTDKRDSVLSVMKKFKNLGTIAELPSLIRDVHTAMGVDLEKWNL